MWAYMIFGIMLGLLGGSSLKGLLNHKNKINEKVKFAFAVIVSAVLIIACDDYNIKAGIFAGLLTGFLLGTVFGSKGYAAPQNIEKSIAMLDAEIKKAEENLEKCNTRIQAAMEAGEDTRKLQFKKQYFITLIHDFGEKREYYIKEKEKIETENN